MARSNLLRCSVIFKRHAFGQMLRVSPVSLNLPPSSPSSCCLLLSILNANDRCQKRYSSTKPYFITTPIFYVNAAPHIGHLYSVLLADVTARWRSLHDQRIVFTTGTDEHGLKIQQAAATHKTYPQDYCDRISENYKSLFEQTNVRHTDFVRTTEKRHKDAVKIFWNKLVEKGFIYEGSYEGWYCTPDESFLTSEQVTQSTDSDGNTLTVSAESGHPVEWTSEENYMFRLSQLAPQLSDWLRGDVIKPRKFGKIVEHWLAEGLPDLSVSRQRNRLQWGIPVPGDDTQTIYVWLDALVNYLTVGGYPQPDFLWPADCHVVGKDILKFHAIYWPAFLLAAGLDPPSSILCHSHWTVDGQKMSKSKGNVVDPFDRISRYSSDGLRYFLLREGVPHSDGNYSDKKVVECLNSELGNTLGNLLSRCTGRALNPEAVFPSMSHDIFQDRANQEDQQMIQDLKNLPGVVDQYYRNYETYRAVDAIMTQLRQTNAFVQHHKPWELKNETGVNKDWLRTIISVTMETLRVCGILLQPVIPNMADSLLTKLSVPQLERDWKSVQNVCVNTYANRKLNMDVSNVLFPRIK